MPMEPAYRSSERMRGKYLRAPDTRLHVYHCEMQSVLHYDFGDKGRYQWRTSGMMRNRGCLHETHKLRSESRNNGVER